VCADVEERATARKQRPRPSGHVAREAPHEDLPVNRVGEIDCHAVATGNRHIAGSLMGRDRIQQEALAFDLQRATGGDHAFENRHRAPPVTAIRDLASAADTAPR
jgi:hypothetical protein